MFRHPSLGPRFNAAATAPLVLAALTMGEASSVFAHAQYTTSSPASNAALAGAPASVQVSFTEEMAALQITVAGPDGSDVTTDKAYIDPGVRTNGSVRIRNAGPGPYAVIWHNVSSDDGDANDGSFVFTVTGPTPNPTLGSIPLPSSATVTRQANAPPPAPIVASQQSTQDDQVTPGINDVRINTYRKRQAIRDRFRGQIDELTFNDSIADGKGLESALADARAAKKGG